MEPTFSGLGPFADDFARAWGLDVSALRSHLLSRLKPPYTQEALTRYAMDHRDAVLRPVLRKLSDRLHAGLTYRVGAACRAYVEDAVGQTLQDILKYWKPRWATPEGEEHLHNYAFCIARQRAHRWAQLDQEREAKAPQWDREPPQDPETLVIRDLEERQRDIAVSKLRDLNWLTQVLTEAEATAVHRWLGPNPTDGLSPAQLSASRKAFQRGRARLQANADQLVKERRGHQRVPAGFFCVVERYGTRMSFEVIDQSAGGLGLVGAVDGASLELGVDYTVTLYFESAVLSRGARCVRIDRVGQQVRMGLQFHFQHPVAMPWARAGGAQLSL